MCSAVKPGHSLGKVAISRTMWALVFLFLLLSLLSQVFLTVVVLVLSLIPLRGNWVNGWVRAWLLAVINPPHLLTCLHDVAKHGINGQHEVISFSGHILRNWILTYLGVMFLSPLKFCIFCEIRNSDKNSEIQKMLEGCRLWSSAVLGISQQAGILRTGTLMTRWNQCSQCLNLEGRKYSLHNGYNGRETDPEVTLISLD